jgi:hypothetical protein
MTARATDLDRLVADLAAVRDEELRGEIESAHAQALLARILAEPRPRRRRRRALLVALPAAALAAAAVAGLVVATRGAEPASAAAELERVAAVARTQSPIVARPGQFVYTKSTSLSIDTYAVKGGSFSALIPWSRESWVGPTGGLMRQVPGEARFISDRDRQAWIAAGRPSFTGPVAAEPTTLPPARPLDLPTDPGRLYDKLEHDASSYGPRLYDEMFVYVGDSLRETNASPEQRAALYQVAARIPGVELVGPVDSAGRRGIAVAKDDDVNRIRSVLVFDPSTSVLLAEEESTLDGNSLGYPAGTRIESITYLETTVVDSLGPRS